MKKWSFTLAVLVLFLPLMLSCQNVVNATNNLTNDTKDLDNTKNSNFNSDIETNVTECLEQMPVILLSLAPELELKLREDYCQFIGGKLEDIKVYGYVGSYSGCEVITIGHYPMYVTLAYWSIEVAGCNIVFTAGGSCPMVYKDSKFYGLAESYDTGLITKEDVYNIGLRVGLDFPNAGPEPKVLSYVES